MLSSDVRLPSFLAPLAVASLVAAAAWSAIPTVGNGTPGTFDQDNYHGATIAQMTADLPVPRLDSYESATAPGYHLVMAVIAKSTHSGVRGLQWVSSVFGVILIALAARVAARYTTPWRAAALTVPLAVSKYIVAGSIWLSTDNMAWLFVAASLAAMLHEDAAGGAPLRSAVFAAVATATRQTNVWLAVPMAAAHFMAPAHRRSVTRFVTGLAIIAAPAAALFALWGGLTPPAFQELHTTHKSLASPALMLATLGAIAPGFLIIARVPLDDVRRRSIAGAAIAGALVAAIAPTTFDLHQGRWGGPIWFLALHTPAIGHTSVAVVLLSMGGAAALVLLWRSAQRRGHGRDATVLLAALAGLAAAVVFNSSAFERYFQPMILLSLSWLTAMSAPPALSRRWIVLGCVAAALAAMTFVTVWLQPKLLSIG